MHPVISSCSWIDFLHYLLKVQSDFATEHSIMAQSLCILDHLQSVPIRMHSLIATNTAWKQGGGKSFPHGLVLQTTTLFSSSSLICLTFYRCIIPYTPSIMPYTPSIIFEDNIGKALITTVPLHWRCRGVCCRTSLSEEGGSPLVQHIANYFKDIINWGSKIGLSWRI